MLVDPERFDGSAPQEPPSVEAVPAAELGLVPDQHHEVWWQDQMLEQALAIRGLLEQSRDAVVAGNNYLSEIKLQGEYLRAWAKERAESDIEERRARLAIWTSERKKWGDFLRGDLLKPFFAVVTASTAAVLGACVLVLIKRTGILPDEVVEFFAAILRAL